MKFVRAVWKLLVGIKDALVLLFMLLFFGAIYAALSARPEPVRDGVLALDLKGGLVEQPAALAWSDVAGGSSARQYRLRDLVAAVDAAKDDSRVKAIALDLDSFSGGGQVAIGDLADALRRVRAAGKPVVAYATGYDDDGYQLASAASEIWLNPLGAVVVTGPGGSNLYFKGLLDKLGVTANVYRVGTYKSAVEPFIRNDMSPEAKRNYQALDNAELDGWRTAVRTARPKANTDLFLKDMNGAVAAAGGDMAKAALNAGLVDKLGERRQFEARLVALGGKGRTKDGAFSKIPLAAYIGDKVDRSPDGKIGVVTIAGMIVDGKAAAGTAGGDTIAKAIERGVRDDIQALVVRIDSPGGSVTASERIRQALVAAKANGIPIVVSMGNVAASGGYWVATPADFIYAEPSTITGSIGVFGVIPSFQNMLQKIGVGADGVKTTPLSGEPDVFKGPSPEANQMIQTGVESIYRRFLGIVAQSRHKTPQQVDAIAQGQVWDGGTARQIGLIDGFGGVDDAIAKAAALAKLGKDRSVRYLDAPRSYRDELIESFASRESEEALPTDAFALLAGRPQAQLAAALADARSILTGPTVQVRCMECGSALPPTKLVKSDLSLIELIRVWLA
ncbi:MAG: signal peptide peptidase SppA [Sphingomicrobium sp.]